MSAWHRLFWRIDVYLAGEIRSPAAEARLRRHLRSCVACRAHYDRGVELLRAARGDARLPGAGELERLVRRAGHMGAEPRAVPWRRPIIGIAVAAAAALVFVLLPSRPIVGTVKLSGGRTLVGDSPCSSGCAVQEGELVAAVEGAVLIVLKGHREVTLAEGTVVSVITEGADVVLQAGQARFSVEPGHGRFGVQVGSTRVEVKGTVFAVARRGEADVTVAVERGRVEVTGTEGSVTVGEGQRTRVGSGGTPEPPSAFQQSDFDLLKELGRLGDEIRRGLRKLFGQ